MTRWKMRLSPGSIFSIRSSEKIGNGYNLYNRRQTYGGIAPLHRPSCRYPNTLLRWRDEARYFHRGKKRLPKGFDLVMEGDHYHLEWDKGDGVSSINKE